MDRHWEHVAEDHGGNADIGLLLVKGIVRKRILLLDYLCRKILEGGLRF